MLGSLLLANSASGSWLDPVIIGIIVVSVALGFFRGLIRSIAGLLGLVVAAIFAGQFAALFDPALNQAGIQHPPITGAVAFVLAFVIIFAAVELAANLLRFLQTMLFLGWVDRLGGAFFGLIRGIILSMVLVAGLAMFGSSQFNASLRQAQIAVLLWQNASALTGMLPAGMEQSMIRLMHSQAPFLGALVPGQ
ncbi:MAG TPA: CvpA family protein [Chloroflexota bacterium]|nr:CvpA family protein [Chloroflexota bacterium]